MNQQENQAYQATINHVKRFVDKVTIATHELLYPLNINESDEMRQYIKDVLTAANNLILEATLTKKSAEHVKMMDAAAEDYMRHMTERSNEQEAK
ncbi:hypothetical protein CPL00188L_CDS0028 [Escherichia phage WaterSpirit]